MDIHSGSCYETLTGEGGTGKVFDLYQVHKVYPKIIKIDGALLVSYWLQLCFVLVQQAWTIRKDDRTEPHGPVSNPWLSTDWLAAFEMNAFGHTGNMNGGGFGSVYIHCYFKKDKKKAHSLP